MDNVRPGSEPQRAYVLSSEKRSSAWRGAASPVSIRRFMDSENSSEMPLTAVEILEGSSKTRRLPSLGSQSVRDTAFLQK